MPQQLFPLPLLEVNRRSLPVASRELMHAISSVLASLASAVPEVARPGVPSKN